MPKKQVRGTSRTTSKPTTAKKGKTAPVAQTVPTAKGSPDLAVQVRRLAADVEAMRLEIRKRPGGGSEEGGARRDQDKILADRLARLDEKIESLWGRVADLEEHFEGESGTRTREPDYDEAPDRDFYEH
jgi:hypothetical protein